MLIRFSKSTLSIFALVSMYSIAGCDPGEGSGDGGSDPGTTTNTGDPGTGGSGGGGATAGAGGATVISEGGAPSTDPSNGGSDGGSGGVADGGAGGSGGAAGGAGGAAGGAGGAAGGAGGVAGGGVGGVGGGAAAACGDGVLQGEEQCDDGNLSDSDACTAACKLPVCGDGVKSFGEACDDANLDDSDACLATCEVARCGDGFLRAGIEACDDGNVFDVDGCNSDCVVSGSQIRGLEDRGQPGVTVRAQAVATDSLFNALVVGSKEGDGAWVRSLTPGGALQWMSLYNGPFGGKTEALGVATDSHRNVIVCGFQSGAAGDTDLWVRKYAEDGQVLWTWTHDEAGADDKAYSVAVDQAGEVVIAGAVSSEKGADIAVIKLGEDGTLRWMERIAGPSGGEDRALGIATNGLNDVFVTGFESDGTGPVPWLAKFGSEGDVMWEIKGGELLGQAGFASAVAIAKYGDVVVTGAESTKFGQDLVLARFNIDGAPVWSRRYDGAFAGDDAGHDVLVDGAGDIVVCGEEGISGGPTGLLRKYSPSGDLRWTRDPFDAAAPFGVLHGCAAGFHDAIATAGEKPDGSSGAFASYSFYAR